MKWLKRESLVATILIAVFIGLSLATVNRFSIWHDESYSATLIEGSYSDIVERTAWDVHPPLYYLLLKAWSSIIGDGLVQLRLFSLVCMVGAIAVAWRLLRRQFGVRAGLYALAGMSFGAFLIRYSQEMRMYALGALLAAATTYILWRLIENDLSKRSVRYLTISYALLMTAALFTHYFLLFLLATHVIFVLLLKTPKPSAIFKSLRKLQARFWACFILPALFFAPWLPTLKDQYDKVQNAFWIGAINFETLPSTVIDFFMFRQQWELISWGALFGLLVFISAAIVVGKWFKYGRQSEVKKAHMLLGCILIVPTALLVFASLPPLQPAYQDRYLSFYAPMLYGCFGMALAYWLSTNKRLWGRGVALIMFGAVVCGVVFVSLLGNNQGWRPEPYFTSKDINRYVLNTDPQAEVVSTSLWTFLDAHMTLGRQVPTRLYSPNGIGQYGNGSAVYNRPELIITDLKSIQGPTTAWVLEESGMKTLEVPSNWYKLDDYQKGYARLVHYRVF